MMYLISTFHFWLLLALAFGVLVGWITISRRGGGWGGTLPWLIAIGLGAAVAFMKVWPQRTGLWWELGTLLVAGYFIGCCLGSLIGGMFGKKLGEPAKSGALADASRPVTRVMIREKERAVDPQLKPLAAAAAAPEEPVVGLAGPRNGVADDLTKIYGIDAETQKKLNGLGIYHYEQLANFTPGNRRWVFRSLGHEGRFPSWWWRWRYDAEALMKGSEVSAAVGLTDGDAAAQLSGGAQESGELNAGASVDATLSSGTSATPPATQADAKGAGSKGGDAAVAALPEADRPPTLAAPEGGSADDLKRIRGIGKQNEARLHGLGIWHFHQIAAWTSEQAHWVGTYLAFPGRIEREDWINQAKVLAQGGETEFSKRADAGLVATSRDDGNDGQANVAVPGKDFDANAPRSKT